MRAIGLIALAAALLAGCGRAPDATTEPPPVVVPLPTPTVVLPTATPAPRVRIAEPGPAVVTRVEPKLPAAQKQAARWVAAKVNPRHQLELDQLVARYERTRGVYQAIEAMRPNGVPAPVVFGLLYREADNDMTCSPAQGDPLIHRSRHVPRGRIPGLNPPYTFIQAAEDAYYSPDLDHLDTKDWAHLGAVLENVEGFNGLGYERRGVVSPYVWSGTSVYLRGKYTGDGRYDPVFVDHQMGVAAVLKRMVERGIKLRFVGEF